MKQHWNNANSSSPAGSAEVILRHGPTRTDTPHLGISSGTLREKLGTTTIYTMDKARSIGNIVGIRISFEGAGEIKTATLQGRGDKIDLFRTP